MREEAAVRKPPVPQPLPCRPLPALPAVCQHCLRLRADQFHHPLRHRGFRQAAPMLPGTIVSRQRRKSGCSMNLAITYHLGHDAQINLRKVFIKDGIDASCMHFAGLPCAADLCACQGGGPAPLPLWSMPQLPSALWQAAGEHLLPAMKSLSAPDFLCCKSASMFCLNIC